MDERASWVSEWNEINGGVLDEITRGMIVETFKKWFPWGEAILRSVMPLFSLPSTALDLVEGSVYPRDDAEKYRPDS